MIMHPSHPQRPPCSMEQRMSCHGLLRYPMGRNRPRDGREHLVTFDQHDAATFVSWGSAEAALLRMPRNIAPELTQECA
jgi:hypothetical protein